jgi:hypothetical protein
MTPRDYPDAWAQLYQWLGYHRGAAVSADSVRSKMRALSARLGNDHPLAAPVPAIDLEQPPLMDLDPRQLAAGERRER